MLCQTVAYRSGSCVVQNYVVLLDSTLPRSQYDYVLPQVSFTAAGYHKHITLVFSPTVSSRGRRGRTSAVLLLWVAAAAERCWRWVALPAGLCIQVPRCPSAVPSTKAAAGSLVVWSACV